MIYRFDVVVPKTLILEADSIVHTLIPDVDVEKTLLQLTFAKSAKECGYTDRGLHLLVWETMRDIKRQISAETGVDPKHISLSAKAVKQAVDVLFRYYEPERDKL